MKPIEADRILRQLAAAGVDFVVIGGVAAVLQGAPIMTADLDLVHSREAGNVARLLHVLRGLGARYRHRRDISPDESHLASPGHQLLETDAGSLDLLGMVAGGGGYAELCLRSSALDIGDGVLVRVLDLEAIIELEERVGRDKDRASLPELRRTLEEIRRRKRP